MESSLKRNRKEAPLASWSSPGVNRSQRSAGCRHFAPLAGTAATVNVTSAPLAGTDATGNWRLASISHS
jgi:hypothetical protein